MCVKYKDVLYTQNDQWIIIQHNNFKFQISETESGSVNSLLEIAVVALNDELI